MPESEYNEVLLEEDSFGEPKVISGPEAIGYIISNLLKTPKGTIPDAPDVSVFLKEVNHIDVDATSIAHIQRIITDRLHRFLPDMPFTAVEVDKVVDNNGNNVLLVGIEALGENFLFSTSEEDNYTKLNQIKINKEELAK